MTFAGFASRLDSGVSVDAGGEYSTFSGVHADNYGQLYLGATKENFGVRVSYSPMYFGRYAAWYGEMNGSLTIVDPFRVIAHIGLLATRNNPAYGGFESERVVDARVGFALDASALHCELVWVGTGNAGATYQFIGNNSRNAFVVSASRLF